MYEVFTRIDESGAVVLSEEGLFKESFASIEEAIEAAGEIPGGFVRRNPAGEVILPGWTA